MRRCYISYNLLQKYLNYATVRGLYFTILDLTSTLQQVKEYSTLTISINTVILKVSCS